MDIFQNLSAIVLPFHCLVCHRRLSSSFLCFRCTPNPLPYVAEPMDGTLAVRSLHFIWEYDDVSRDFIHVMKYEPSRRLCLLAGELLATSLPSFISWDLAVPIPSSKTTLKERGFNQCAIMASKLPLLVVTDILSLKKQRPRQAITSIKRRKANMRGAFSVKQRLTGKRILIVDDVVTTGATVNEAAKVLIKAGAASVDVIALAKAYSYI